MAHADAPHGPGHHKAPKYMTIFWWLAILTVVEIGVIFMPVARIVITTALVWLALCKAALVALYFMHLRFEVRTLGYIALTPLVIGTLLLLVLMPDSVGLGRRTADSAKIAAPTH
jgi:cytochrome c oxidase subunit 4